MNLTGIEINKVFSDTWRWVKLNDFSGKDVCDVTSLPLYQKLQSFSADHTYGKYLYAPFYRMYRYSPNLIRSLAGLTPYRFPQAFALMISALVRYPETKRDEIYRNDLLFMMNELIKSNSAEEGYYAWGQPYDWFSRKKIPAFTPRTTVTTQAAHAMLDAYTFFREERYLEIARKAGRFLIDKMQWDIDDQGDICFPYTSVDRYHIHNANVLAAALLSRLSSITDDQNMRSYAERAFSFTARQQHPDGSWYYWAAPDRILGKIDHYHTGFVLESFKVGKNFWKGEFPFDQHLEKGMRFYLEQLFLDEKIPKMLPDSLYPVDIQSCAQAIITIAEVLPAGEYRSAWLQRVLEWTITNMYNEKNGYFFYRIYKDRIDKTPYLRWGQAWMLRAMTYIIKANETI
jgi:hypothetical protein